MAHCSDSDWLIGSCKEQSDVPLKLPLFISGQGPSSIDGSEPKAEPSCKGESEASKREEIQDPAGGNGVGASGSVPLSEATSGEPDGGKGEGAGGSRQLSGTTVGDGKVLLHNYNGAVMGSLRVFQINLHHSRSASAILGKWLSEDRVDIALIQEPWVRDGRILGLGCNNNSLFYDRTSCRPRACIYVSPKIKVINMVGFLDSDNVAVKIVQPKGQESNEIIISSSYLPYDKSDPLSEEIKALIGYCSKNNKKLILGCDANAHHVVWGSSDCNQRGENLLEYILRHNLYILNRGNDPTFVTCNRREVIDLTLCSNNCYEHIRDWRVSDEVTLSDHQLIHFTVTGSSESQTVLRRNPRKTDWGSFRSLLEEKIPAIHTMFLSDHDLDLAVDSMQQAIIKSYHQSCNMSTTSSPRLVPWWNTELSKKRHITRRLFNKAKKSGEWTAYKAALTDYNRCIRDAKKESWQSYCDKLNDIPATARLVKLLARDNRSHLNAVKLPDGKFTVSGEETLEEMIRVHFPLSTVSSPTSSVPSVRPLKGNKERWTLANKIVSEDRISWAIESFDSYKSPGPDEVIPILLKEGKDILVPVLNSIFKACLAFGFVPTSWRQTKAIFMPKPGKDNYYDAKSFRPISLSSFLLKTLEKLVDRHIREGILSVNPLSSSQHAYQPGKSTSTALYDLSSLLEKNIKAKEIALAVFMDIEGAFDKVPINSILNGLLKKGADQVTIDWIKSFLMDRYISISLLGDTKTIKVKAGCPQGGVLSPILWCLVVDSLLDDIKTMGAVCIGYADDIAIIVRGKFIKTISGILRGVLKKVEVWCNREGLSVNPAKTTLVAFTRLRSVSLEHIKFYGHTLVYSKEVKFLGVIFDDKLLWKRHLDYCISKAKRIFWSCRGAIGRTWGLNPKVIRWIYQMIICPIITYGAVAWWSRTLVDSAKADLAKVQRMVCIAMTGAIRTTPTASLELLLDIYPLHMYIEAEALLCKYRFRYLGLWDNYSEYLSWKDLNSKIQKHPIFNMKSDGIPVKYVFDRSFKVTFPPRGEWKVSGDDTSALTWYTDGSKMNNGTGSGVCCPDDGSSFWYPLGKFTTIFQAEIHAILMCCRICINRGYRNRCINICSDSQAALLALQKHIISSGIVWDCFNALCNLSRTGANYVHLYWVPGHSGIHGNELADALARKGSSTPFVGPEPVLGISKDCIRDTVFRLLRKQQYHDWAMSKDQRQARELNSGCPSTRAKELMKLNRNGIRRAVGLLTGHCSLRRHLCIMGTVKDPICRGCKLADETAAHILCECEVYSAHRFEHLGRHLLEPWELQDIPVRCMLNFISATGLM